MAHAVALLSGGLDSILSVLLLRKQGIKVTAVTFLMHFGCDMSDKASCTTDSTHIAHRFGFEVKMCHLADKFIRIVKDPKFGHGKNMNPCMDCRILMLREARELMGMVGADFVSTGEVLGQRPMSQRRDTFPVIDREAGLKGMVVRPLSAKQLNVTEPEKRGLVDREQLCDFMGRSRKPQMALAGEFGLTEYPPPAGGCLLTDPIYSVRLRELLAHVQDPSVKDLHLLRAGRQFRLPSGAKLVVGRHEQDNLKIESLADKSDTLLHVPDAGSPLAMVQGGASGDELRLASAICARFSDAKREPIVNVQVGLEAGGEIVSVTPIADVDLDQFRI